MKTLTIFFIISLNLLAQSDLLTLMDNGAPKLTELTNIMAWYKGDYGLTPSGWLDASGNSRDLHFNTTAWTPNLTNTKNNIKTALFDGVNDRTDSVMFTTTDYTVYAVLKNGATHTNYDAFLSGGATSIMPIRQGGSSGALQSYNSSAQAYNETVALGQWGILMTQVQTFSQRVYTQVNNNTRVGGTVIGGNNLTGFKMGGRFDNTIFGTFEVAEVIVYNAFHDATQIASVLKYLNAKYKIY